MDRLTHAAELIRRLQHMLGSHSDSVQWYRNQIAQALRSVDALPARLLTFEDHDERPTDER